MATARIRAPKKKATKVTTSPMAVSKPTKTPAKKAMQPMTLAVYRKAHPDRVWVQRIVESSPKSGKPVRVEIQCQHKGCKELREIASQDAFQVKFCSAAHRRAARKEG